MAASLVSMSTLPAHGLGGINGGMRVGGMPPEGVPQHEDIETPPQKSGGHRVRLPLRQHQVGPARGDDDGRPGILEGTRLLVRGRSIKQDRFETRGSLPVEVDDNMAHSLMLVPGIRGCYLPAGSGTSHTRSPTIRSGSVSGADDSWMRKTGW